MKLRITFDANPITLNNKSGVGYFVKDMVKSLAKQSDELDLNGYYFDFGRRKNVDDLPSAKNIAYTAITYIPGKALNALRRGSVQLPLRFFFHKKTDVLWSTNYVPTLTMKSVKNVLNVYDLAYIDCPVFVQERNLQFLLKWAPRSIMSSDLIVVNSRFTKDRLVEVYEIPRDKIIVLPIPAAEHAKPDDGILKKYSLNSNYILFVGTIEPRKNVITLLNAYSHLPEALKHKHPLVLAGGKGWRDEEIIERINELRKAGSNIIQTGYISNEEKAALYDKALLYVQPSHYEGFGMPILEAMSYGKAVVCSDIPVFREIAGSSAVYFDKDDEAELARVTEIFLTNKDLRDKASVRSLEHLKTFPNWDSVAKDFYDELVKL